MISGKTKVCGIIANPVEHSMSPMMQNFYAEKTGADFAYVPLKVEEESLEAAILGAYALNLVGMNVTIPYKQKVMEYLTEIDEDARVIGAVNTLVRIEGGYKGYNTDAAGLLRAMSEADIGIKDSACILIGAGGAAKAAAYVLVKSGARIVYILNRKLERAVSLASDMNRLLGRNVMIPLALEEYRKIPKGSYLAIQSTSVGMYPDVNHTFIEDADFYKMIHTGIDMIYTPMKTKFMLQVARAGGRTRNGLDMLLYQGIIAFEMWNPQVTVDAATIRGARELLSAELKKCM